ncbi:MAG TPA: hypothetical protein VKB18_00805 [Gemmatimonadota bacterium]|nr:hypothetical protein [Gemmatimonadota bacterium]
MQYANENPCPGSRLGRLLVPVVLGLLLTIPACQQQPTGAAPLTPKASGTKRPSDVPVPLFEVNVWGEGELWQMLDAHEPSNADEASAAPFYVIAPVDASDPQSTLFFGAHDHVVPVPPANHGTYSDVWHLVFVVPASGTTTGSDIGDEADVLVRSTLVGDLAYAADLDGNGTVESDEVLTSDDRVDAAEERGLVTITDAFFPDFVFICPVRPL